MIEIVKFILAIKRFVL